jgi:glutamate N-acetyltransferase/amino-acid N-acetyltransferase
VHIGGMCKGSGMIHPNMATMLGIVTCDAAVEPAVWRDMLRRACEASFNAVRCHLSQHVAKMLPVVAV